MQSGLAGRSSVFKVLYTPTRGKRRCLEGTMYVEFDRTVLIDAETRRSVCVVTGTGLRPNPIFVLMETAGKGAEWAAGTELNVGNFAVQVEETMLLHLLPYVDCMEPVQAGDKSEESADQIVNSKDGFECEIPPAVAVAAAQECMISPVPPSQVCGAQGLQAHVRVRMRTTQLIIQELTDAYPHLFS